MMPKKERLSRAANTGRQWGSLTHVSCAVLGSIFLLLTAELPGVSLQGLVTKCRISVSGGEDQRLTCVFETDQQKVISVVKNYNDTTEAVLDCVWTEDAPKCVPGKGYENGTMNKKEAQVTIPGAKAKEDGQYSCQMLGESVPESKPESCTFYPDNTGSQHTTKQTTTARVTETTHHRNEQQTNGTHSDTENNTVGLAVGIPLSVIIVLAVVFIVWRYRGRCQRTTRNGTSQPIRSPQTSVSFQVPRHISPKIEGKVKYFETGSVPLPISSEDEQFPLVQATAEVSQTPSQSGNADEEHSKSAHSDFQTDDTHSVAKSTGSGIPSSEKGDGAQKTQNFEEHLSDENETSNTDPLSDAPVLDDGAQNEEDSLDV